MIINNRRLLSALLVMPFIYMPVGYAAKPIDLSRQNLSVLQSIIAGPQSEAVKGIHFKEFKRTVDSKNTAHVRIQETYMGHQVWGADAIIHIPDSKGVNTLSATLSEANTKRGTMDGIVYQDINADLINTPAYVFTEAQAQKAIKEAVSNYQTKVNAKPAISNQQSQLIVFIDEQNTAHWAYKVNFLAEPTKPGEMPAKPGYIIDAVTLKVYAEWNDIKTLEELVTAGGGFGGNSKMGKLSYDGLSDVKDHYAKLQITRDDSNQTCSLKNTEVTVRHYGSTMRVGPIPTFKCEKVDPQHNDIFWDDAFHAVNGGFSPDNDALFGGNVIKSMYTDWYKVNVLEKSGKPMMLLMVVHDKIDNAYWDGEKMTFGDGVKMFYPLTSLGVAAHEISHGFTEQHSDLNYYGQSGGLNEAFSDMAAQAAEQFAYGKSSWQIGGEIYKKENESLRYLDKPSKDCKGKKPGQWCSIDNAKQYFPGLDVHYSSGVYNRFFYTLGTTANWDAKKAFEVMVNANMHYWTSNVNFVSAACGVLKATKALGYTVADVQKAFSTVEIDTKSCKL